MKSIMNILVNIGERKERYKHGSDYNPTINNLRKPLIFLCTIYNYYGIGRREA
jgi:hypothetical protein